MERKIDFAVIKWRGGKVAHKIQPRHAKSALVASVEKERIIVLYFSHADNGVVGRESLARRKAYGEMSRDCHYVLAKRVWIVEIAAKIQFFVPKRESSTQFISPQG